METHEYEKLNKGKPDLTGSCVCGRPYDDLCHSKAPENKLPALEQASQAPTDESWEKELQEIMYSHKYPNRILEVKSFIASLLQKENKNAMLRQRNYDQKLFEAGKSEAFSLVKNAIAKLRINETPNVEQGYPKMIGYNHALDNLLSTLEGK